MLYAFIAFIVDHFCGFLRDARRSRNNASFFTAFNRSQPLSHTSLPPPPPLLRKADTTATMWYGKRISSPWGDSGPVELASDLLPIIGNRCRIKSRGVVTGSSKPGRLQMRRDETRHGRRRQRCVLTCPKCRRRWICLLFARIRSIVHG